MDENRCDSCKRPARVLYVVESPRGDYRLCRHCMGGDLEKRPDNRRKR